MVEKSILPQEVLLKICLCEIIQPVERSFWSGLRGERVKTVWMTVLRKRVTKIRSRRAEPVEVNGTTIFSEVSEPERLIIVQAKGSQQSKEY